MNRYIFVISLCVSVAILTGASPIADLIAGVEILETQSQTVDDLVDQVARLEGQVGDLTEEIDAHPVLVDANGKNVGLALGLNHKRIESHTIPDAISIGLQVEGFPSFLLKLQSSDFFTGNALTTIKFENHGCTGRAILKDATTAFSPVGVYRNVVYRSIGGTIQTFSANSQVRTNLDGSIDCQNFAQTAHFFGVREALPIIDLDDHFTSPFHLEGGTVLPTTQ